MKTSIILLILFLGAGLLNAGYGEFSELSTRQNGLLPWQIIAEKLHGGSWFCGYIVSSDNDTQKDKILQIGDVDPDIKYNHLPDQSLSIRLSEKAADFYSSEKMNIGIAEFVGGSWRDVGQTITSSVSDEINLAGGISKEGFYRLNFAVVNQGGQTRRHEAYVIVCSNWKRDILTFCRALKEEIEVNKDTQLIRSSIAVSHFDHAMEMISESSFLSGKILNAIANAVRSKQAFDKGQCPDFITGLNKIRLRRFKGAPIEGFAVFVPDCYESTKAWPVFLHIGDTGWSSRNDYPSDYGLIDMWWRTVSYKELRWKDYITVMALVKEKLNIDENRIYVDGDCLNGISAIALALHHPDYWAECSASLGNSYRYLATNALNLPLIFIRGEHGTNQDSFTGYFNFALKCFQYAGCRYLKGSRSEKIVEVRGTPIPEAIRENNPWRVSYAIESLGNPKAYWLEINGRQDENLVGTIDASVDGQTVFVKTKNIDAYNLNLTQAPLDANGPVEIVENGQKLGLATNEVFVKKGEKYRNALYIKNTFLHGPVWDVFTDPYVVVWGKSSDDERLSEISEQVAKSLAGGGPIFSDANVPENLIDSHNLILVGTLDSNLWLSKISKQLPVLVKDGEIIAKSKRYDGSDLGFILIYPNPINNRKYVAVFSGTSPQAIAKIPKAYSQIKSIRPIDVGIFELTNSGSVKWHIFEKFNTVWDWHSDYDRAIFVLNKKHPKWQWRQWIAKVVKGEFKADVVVLENPFLFEDSVLIGQVTYRDLFNTFENVWFTKVRMKGKILRSLLTVPFEDISKRDTDTLIIDGINMVRSPVSSGEGILAINDLLDDAVYTVVLPEECLNGQRMGLVIEDYEIENQNYLIPILREYLGNNVDADIEAQLDNIKLNVF